MKRILIALALLLSLASCELIDAVCDLTDVVTNGISSKDIKSWGIRNISG